MGTKSEQMKGRAKEAAGRLTGNRKLEREGKADRSVAEAREGLGNALNKIEDVTNSAIARARDMLRRR
jgi:uncharacterized protein YjbJ (UPF0337 family)